MDGAHIFHGALAQSKKNKKQVENLASVHPAGEHNLWINQLKE